MTVDDYIDEAYDRMKQQLQRFCDGRGLEWSEDVYHDTILKMKAIEQKKGGRMDDPTLRGLDNYLFMAYKINALRELQYPRNSKTITTPVLPDKPDVVDDSVQPSERLVEYLRQQYGEQLTSLYLRKAAGEKVRDLVDESGITNLTPTFKAMANDARAHHDWIIHGK